LAGQAHADVRDVALQLLVVVDAHFTPDFRVRLLADGQLLGLAHQAELFLARDRVRGAGDRQAEDEDGQAEAGHEGHLGTLWRRRRWTTR
jgi:hypothetical protein